MFLDCEEFVTISLMNGCSISIDFLFNWRGGFGGELFISLSLELFFWCIIILIMFFEDSSIEVSFIISLLFGVTKET